MSGIGFWPEICSPPTLILPQTQMACWGIDGWLTLHARSELCAKMAHWSDPCKAPQPHPSPSVSPPCPHRAPSLPKP